MEMGRADLAGASCGWVRLDASPVGGPPTPDGPAVTF
jgi:hypothetical protein